MISYSDEYIKWISYNGGYNKWIPTNDKNDNWILYKDKRNKWISKKHIQIQGCLAGGSEGDNLVLSVSSTEIKFQKGLYTASADALERNPG